MPPIEKGVAILGCGLWGINHVRAWQELGHLRVACDVDDERLAVVRNRWPDLETSSNVTQTLSRADVSACVIATPAETHASLALRAMLAGKDVLVEKPMALTSGEGRRMLDAAVEMGRILAVGHILEHHPAMRKLIELAEDGALGRIRYVYSNRLNFGRIRTRENALWSFAPHDIAIILRLLGSVPEEVRCSGGSYVSKGIADVTLTSMRFFSDVQAHIFVSWLHPYKEHRLVVVGDRHMAVFDDAAPWPEKLTLYPHQVDWLRGRVPIACKAEAVPVPVEPAEPLKVECQEFWTCVARRETPLVDGRNGLAVLEVLEAAERSLVHEERTERVGESTTSSQYVHPTASVDPSAIIGEGTSIWHHSTVLEEARVGEGSVLGQNTFVGRHARIGRRARIQNNVSVYEGVELEDDVFCGPSMVFTNVLRPRAHVDRKSEFQRTLVKRGATLGANSTILCGVTVGRYSFVAAGAVVTRDVPAHALMVGSPACVAGWVCQCGERLSFATAEVVCWRCARRYMRCEDGQGLQEGPGAAIEEFG